MRLDVRPEPVGTARHRDHRFEVPAHQRPVDHERGTEEVAKASFNRYREWFIIYVVEECVNLPA